MNITSLLITLVGILIMIALYIMSRIAKNKLPKEDRQALPKLKDTDGNVFTSVLDDIPATDGSTPKPSAKKPKKEEIQNNNTVIKESKKVKDVTDSTANTNESSQKILFISAQDENGLDGNIVLQSLKSNGFVFGEMDIFHYMVDLDTEKGMTSLFRVANGLSPWTLTEEDLLNKQLAGLSVVMQFPSKIDDKVALNTFLTVTESLSKSVSGILKNQHQQPLTEDDKINLGAPIK